MQKAGCLNFRPGFFRKYLVKCYSPYKILVYKTITFVNPGGTPRYNTLHLLN